MIHKNAAEIVATNHVLRICCKSKVLFIDYMVVTTVCTMLGYVGVALLAQMRHTTNGNFSLLE